jgi:hypothetical protein
MESSWQFNLPVGQFARAELGRQAPGELAGLAVEFVPEHPKQAGKVRHERREDEFSGHLRIIDVQRTALRTAQRLVKRAFAGLPFFEEFLRGGGLRREDLESDGGVWMGQKPEALQLGLIMHFGMQPGGI